MRQREHPSDLYPSRRWRPAAPRWWRPTWPEKIISGYYAWNGRRCVESGGGGGGGGEERGGGHRELPWYLHGIKDSPIAPF